MTQIAVKQQIDIIKKATRQATKTKESAVKFLVDAGIIDAPVSSTKKKATSHIKLKG